MSERDIPLKRYNGGITVPLEISESSTSPTFGLIHARMAIANGVAITKTHYHPTFPPHSLSRDLKWSIYGPYLTSNQPNHRTSS